MNWGHHFIHFAEETAARACTATRRACSVYRQRTSARLATLTRSTCHFCLHSVSFDTPPRCTTYNCLASGVCGKSANSPDHVPFWVYIIVGICIFGGELRKYVSSLFCNSCLSLGMLATLISMFFIHRNHRRIEREKRMQYWREQNAFRQNILQMQETARHSIMTLPQGGNGSPRSTLYSRDGANSEDSQLPMLTAQSKSSALRHQFSDDGFDGSEESVMIQRVDRKDPNRF